MTRNHIMIAIFLLIALVGPAYYVLQAYGKVFRGVKKAQKESDAVSGEHKTSLSPDENEQQNTQA